jgi:hypothetical protein
VLKRQSPSLKGLDVTGRARFKQADLTRAANALKAAGITIGRLEIEPNGTIVIFPAASGRSENSQTDDDAWARARKNFSAARHARQNPLKC